VPPAGSWQSGERLLEDVGIEVETEYQKRSRKKPRVKQGLAGAKDT
jgi:hypothetical protein